jgi:hypothetical protein
MRPFDFMVTFWGKRYREHFADLCLPSLLAPNNLALLRADDGHRFLIATTTEDWEAISSLPIMQTLSGHATPEWVEVSGSPKETNPDAYARYGVTLRHQNDCQRRLLERAYTRGAYGSLLYPDDIFSDGYVATLLASVRRGDHLLLASAMRQVEEEMIDDLGRMGYLAPERLLSATGQALIIPQRVMAELSVRHLHPEMSIFDQGKPVQPTVLPVCYWPISGGRGLIMRMFFVPMLALIDFAVVPPNHLDCLDNELVENVYANKNFADWDRVGVVQDSDEFAVVSLTPKDVNRSPPSREGLRGPWWAPELKRMLAIRESMRFFAGASRDAFRRDLFRVPVRWHGGELDEVWRREERRIELLISRAVGDYYRVSRPPNRDRFPSRPTFLDMVARGPATLRNYLSRLQNLRRRLWLVVRGDPGARKWLVWRIQVLGCQLRGHTNYPPRPDVR